MRGDVHRYKAPRDAKGHEQTGSRYCVVLQSGALRMLSTWIVAPTSTSARPGPVRPAITVGDKQTRLLVEQITAIDPQRLGEHVGRITLAEQQSVDEALRLVLGLD